MPRLSPQLMLMQNLDSMEDTMVDILVDTMAMEAMCITLARGLLTLTLNLDSIEDMLDIMEATVAMVDTITSARGLLMPRLKPQLMLMQNLDSMEDTVVDILVDTMAMEAMCITLARGLLTLNLDSIEDMVDMEDIEDMEAMDITVARGLLML